MVDLDKQLEAQKAQQQKNGSGGLGLDLSALMAGTPEQQGSSFGSVNGLNDIELDRNPDQGIRSLSSMLSPEEQLGPAPKGVDLNTITVEQEVVDKPKIHLGSSIEFNPQDMQEKIVRLDDITVEEEKKDKPKIDLGASVEITQEDREKKYLKLDQIVVEEEKEKEKERKKIELGSTKDEEHDLDKYFKDLAIDYREGIVWTGATLAGMIVITVVFWVSNWYFLTASKVRIDPPYDEYVEMIRNTETEIALYVPINNKQNYQDMPIVSSQFDSVRAKNTVQTIVNADDINFIHKKDILTLKLDELTTKLVTTSKELEKVRQDISRYGFFSQEIFNLLETTVNNTTLQASLMSLESIKFSAAIKVFSQLNTFIKQFAAVTNYTPEQIVAGMQTILQRGEIDIDQYIKSCYLNPYEIDEQCFSIGDFDRFYGLIDTKAGVDTVFVKNLMAFIDQKLENTDFPSLSLLFRNFDPNANKLSFVAQVNTFPEDEIQLFNQGVLNPHITIVTALVDLLKQSKFIIGSMIDLKNLKVTKRRVMVGKTEFTVNNSTLTLDLPIQKETEREIFDFLIPKGEGNIFFGSAPEDLSLLGTGISQQDTFLSGLSNKQEIGPIETSGEIKQDEFSVQDGPVVQEESQSVAPDTQPTVGDQP